MFKKSIFSVIIVLMSAFITIGCIETQDDPVSVDLSMPNVGDLPDLSGVINAVANKEEAVDLFLRAINAMIENSANSSEFSELLSLLFMFDPPTNTANINQIFSGEEENGITLTGFMQGTQRVFGRSAADYVGNFKESSSLVRAAVDFGDDSTDAGFGDFFVNGRLTIDGIFRYRNEVTRVSDGRASQRRINMGARGDNHYALTISDNANNLGMKIVMSITANINDSFNDPEQLPPCTCEKCPDCNRCVECCKNQAYCNGCLECKHKTTRFLHRNIGNSRTFSLRVFDNSGEKPFSPITIGDFLEKADFGIFDQPALGRFTLYSYNAAGSERNPLPANFQAVNLGNTLPVISRNMVAGDDKHPTIFAMYIAQNDLTLSELRDMFVGARVRFYYGHGNDYYERPVILAQVIGNAWFDLDNNPWSPMHDGSTAATVFPSDIITGIGCNIAGIEINFRHTNNHAAVTRIVFELGGRDVQTINIAPLAVTPMTFELYRYDDPAGSDWTATGITRAIPLNTVLNVARTEVAPAGGHPMLFAMNIDRTGISIAELRALFFGAQVTFFYFDSGYKDHVRPVTLATVIGSPGFRDWYDLDNNPWSPRHDGSTAATILGDVIEINFRHTMSIGGEPVDRVEFEIGGRMLTININ
ncbi:MAG: hypothetical protein FWC97_00825 [Treponema sp.]|nr:hypothetical protein [Treponema sp.]